ncbi:MAG: hypothetical protein WC223_14045 [Bacteroidales bacterium]|jgi:hypothetical protein
MKIQKNLLIIFFCLIFFSTTQEAKALLISDIVDSTINFTAKTTYLVTKYSIKTAIFVVKKTAKGVKEVSKSVYIASKDAFKTPSIPSSKPVESEIQHVNNFTPVNTNLLPPIPKTSFPAVPKSTIIPTSGNSLPVISY